MPIIIPNTLPAYDTLTNENIFVMTQHRAVHQDIRPLKIVLFNLMPDKIQTETQILRLLANSPLQTEIVLLHPKSHRSKNTPQTHLSTFYRHFEDVASQTFDGLIITGAPVEHLAFEDVDYWEELVQVMDWSARHVFSTFHICWGAQAALYHHYGIEKHALDQKKFGVFAHQSNYRHIKLFRGFDDVFYAPHSRHTEVRKSSIQKVASLQVWAESNEAGVYIAASKNGRQIFVTGHSEYDPLTLKHEYERDRQKGRSIALPQNYFPKDDPQKPPVVNWRSHGNLLYANWLNYYVYQETPFELERIRGVF